MAGLGLSLAVVSDGLYLDSVISAAVGGNLGPKVFETEHAHGAVRLEEDGKRALGNVKAAVQLP